MMQLRKLIPKSTCNESSKYDLVFYYGAAHPNKPPVTFTPSFEEVVFPNHQSDFHCAVKALTERGKSLVDSIYSMDSFKTTHLGYKLTKIDRVQIRLPAVHINL